MLLWLAVVERAVQDLELGSEIERRDAARWLLASRHDFHAVCSLADISASAVRARARRLLETDKDTKP